jgi:NAD-dependent deacetylase
MTDREDWKRAGAWLEEAGSAVAFTGAGISTESGIPDFRSPGGVWSKYRQVMYQEFLASDEARREYWRQKCEAHRDFASARPNAGHHALARWESLGRLWGVITQNIDGLHQDAGSRNVLELHGTNRAIVCLDCRRRFDPEALVQAFLETEVVPDCPHCGGPLKHATVSFGQALPADVLEEAVERSQQCDLFLAIGSSLVVEPAASLPRLAKRAGARLVIVNRDPTGLDELADLVLRDPIGTTLSGIDALVVEG